MTLVASRACFSNEDVRLSRLPADAHCLSPRIHRARGPDRCCAGPSSEGVRRSWFGCSSLYSRKMLFNTRRAVSQENTDSKPLLCSRNWGCRRSTNPKGGPARVGAEGDDEVGEEGRKLSVFQTGQAGHPFGRQRSFPGIEGTSTLPQQLRLPGEGYLRRSLPHCMWGSHRHKK